MHMVAVGGSDAGISAALRAREVDPGAEVTVVARRRLPELLHLRHPLLRLRRGPALAQPRAPHDRATWRRPGCGCGWTPPPAGSTWPAASCWSPGPDGVEDLIAYDQLVIGTGAVPVRPPIAGLDTLGPGDGVHLLHSMGDTFALMRTLEETAPASAVIVGAGYIGLEMADALTARGLAVTQIEQLPEVLPTVDPQLGALVHAELAARGVRC